MAKRAKKFNRATRTYQLAINEIQYQTLQIFKALRPDLNSGQAIMEYAYQLFWKHYDDMYLTTYMWLETPDKNYRIKTPDGDYKKVVVYRHYLKEYKLIDSKIEAINKRFNLNINRAEYFRKILLFLFYEYHLLNPMDEQPLLQEMPEDMRDFIKDLDSSYQKEIISAWELNDDKTLEKESVDDKTLAVENKDDITLEIENVDDTSLDIENLDDNTLEIENNDDIAELFEEFDDYTLDYENY